MGGANFGDTGLGWRWVMLDGGRTRKNVFQNFWPMEHVKHHISHSTNEDVKICNLWISHNMSQFLILLCSCFCLEVWAEVWRGCNRKSFAQCLFLWKIWNLHFRVQDRNRILRSDYSIISVIVILLVCFCFHVIMLIVSTAKLGGEIS